MVKLVEFIAKSLVEHPEQVEIKETEKDGVVVIQLKVASEDMGKIIGKQGRIAKPFRTIVKSVAIKENKRVVLEFV